MNPSTYDPYDTFSMVQVTTKLWREAWELVQRLAVMAEADHPKARRLEQIAWARYTRRVYKMNEAEDIHWGAL
jgi:hypothetical protein